MEIPTILVVMRSTGNPVRINAADFNEALHEVPTEARPPFRFEPPVDFGAGQEATLAPIDLTVELKDEFSGPVGRLARALPEPEPEEAKPEPKPKAEPSTRRGRAAKKR